MCQRKRRGILTMECRSQGRSEDLADFFNLHIKKVAKSSAVREDGEGGGGGLKSEEKMLWSLQGICAEASSFPLWTKLILFYLLVSFPQKTDSRQKIF